MTQLKIRFFISVEVRIVFLGIAALYASAVVAAADDAKRITIVTADAALQQNALLWTTPEQWNTPVLPGGTDSDDWVGVAKFSGERYYWFKGSADVQMDVLYVDANRQVVGMLEQVEDTSVHGVCKPVLAVLFLKGGSIRRHGFQTGNLVVPEHWDLEVQTATDEKELTLQLGTMKTKMARFATGSVDAHLELGECFLAQREYTHAQSAYEAVLQQALTIQDKTDVMIGLAKTLAGMGKVDEAIKMFAAVIEKDSRNVTAYLHLARIFRSVKKVEGIVATLATGIERHPELIALRMELAQLYIQTNQVEKAMGLLNEAPSKTKKERAQLSRVMGDAHLRRGDMAAAAESYALYLRFHPSAPHAAELRLFIARHRKKRTGRDL
ncbi:MAG: tetratricopeptide repeat protein [Deltaproteobacteria bacterium]|nr:tetratricopeptide repeat protein [Deltaproteobacteria bacterium]